MEAGEPAEKAGKAEEKFESATDHDFSATGQRTIRLMTAKEQLDEECHES